MILSKLSAPLRHQVISSHCEKVLMESETVGGFSRGVICSLMRNMTTHVAIPEEVIISQGTQDESFHILHSGRAKSLDSVGGKGTIQPGGIISNVEALKREEKHGLPSFSLRAVVYSAKNLPKTDLFGACDPYVEITYGNFGKVRTTVKKITRNPMWKEIFYVKLTADVEEVNVKLYDWNRVEDDEFVGGFTVPVLQMKREEDREYELIDGNGKTGVGSVIMSLHHGRLAAHQKVKSSALTVQAETFCHLYKFDVELIKEVRERGIVGAREEQRDETLQKLRLLGLLPSQPVALPLPRVAYLRVLTYIYIKPFPLLLLSTPLPPPPAPPPVRGISLQPVSPPPRPHAHNGRAGERSRRVQAHVPLL